VTDYRRSRPAREGDGDKAWNTNAALGCGAGPAVSNGTNWRSIYDHALQY
jgi:hypothetical protein